MTGFDFVMKVAQDADINRHYALMTAAETEPQTRRNLWVHFKKRGVAAARLLLQKLDDGQDPAWHHEMIFTLGAIADQQKIEKERTLTCARRLAEAQDGQLRRNAIIVLGWIGGKEEISILGERMLNDDDAKCRAWAGAAFMQMHLRKQPVAGAALELLRPAIPAEPDHFALGCMIESVAEITGKNFRLPRSAVNDKNADKEKIDAAKKRVEKWFNKDIQ